MVLDALKDFLLDIPQFIADLEPDDPYKLLEVPGNSFIKVLDDYSVGGNTSADGFVVSGMLEVPLFELVTYSNWCIFRNACKNKTDEEVNALFLNMYPEFGKAFNLKDFCEHFEDHFLEFLNEAGIREEDVVVTEDSIKIQNINSYPDDEPVDEDDADTSDDDNA